MKKKNKAKSQIDVTDLNQWAVIYADYQNQQRNDRSFAVIGAAMVDAYLINLLRRAMSENITKSEIDDMFDYRNPLGAMSAKIKIAFAFGLIDKMLRDNLDNIRNIRNEFAHGLYYKGDKTSDAIRVSFDAKTIVDMCNRFSIQCSMSSDHGSRDQFYWAIHETCANLAYATRDYVGQKVEKKG